MPRPVERQDAGSERRPPDELRRKARREARPQGAEDAVLELQGNIGNAAVSRLLARQAETASKPEAGGTDTEPPITAPDVTGAQQFNERGMAHYKAGRFEKARAAFAEAHRLNPVSTFLFDQADALEHLGRFAEAADMYERYLAEGPLTSDIPRVRSRIRKLRGEHIAPGEDDDEPPITTKGKAGATAWFDRGQSAFQAGRFAKAADCFRHAFELVPLPEFIFDEGSALEKGRHFAAAANAFEHYLILDLSAKDFDQVIAKIKTLRGQAPPPGKDALMDPEDEESAAPTVTAKGAKGASDWQSRGVVAYRTGDFERAYDCFVQAYDLKPAAAFVYNQAAALQLLGNNEGAVQGYERYLALDPKARDAGQVRKLIEHLRAKTGGTELKQP